MEGFGSKRTDGDGVGLRRLVGFWQLDNASVSRLMTAVMLGALPFFAVSFLLAVYATIRPGRDGKRNSIFGVPFFSSR